jgi:hypothetical protein
MMFNIEPKEGYPHPPDAPTFLTVGDARKWMCGRVTGFDVTGLVLVEHATPGDKGTILPWEFCTCCGASGSLTEAGEYGQLCPECTERML